MLDVMYKIPGDKTIEKVIITGDTVEKGVPAEIVRRNIAEENICKKTLIYR